MIRKLTLFAGLAVCALAAACGQATPTPVPPTRPPIQAATTPAGDAAPKRVQEALSPVPSPAAVSTSPTPSEPATPIGATPARSPVPSGTPVEVDTAKESPGGTREPPEADLFAIARRLRPNPIDSAPRIANPEPVSYTVGHKDSFSVSDLETSDVYTIQATIELVTENAYWYVDDALELSTEKLRAAATAFESELYPLMAGFLGDIWNPGVDNDPRLTVLNTPLKGAAGYFGARDEYPRQTHPQSNQREMIYIDGGALEPGSAAYLGVLVHELAHAVHWNLDPGEDAWVNEGLAEVAGTLSGYGGSALTGAFLRRSDTQLNYWPDAPVTTGPHYGASALFFIYLAQHYGGYESLKELAQNPADGARGVEAYLASFDTTFLDVFKGWVLANFLDSEVRPYGYPDRQVRVTGLDTVVGREEIEDTLPQFATRYIDLRLDEGDAVVTFQGDPEVGQVATKCRTGQYCWWGNRGDSIDSTLTRRFDLAGQKQATLEFWTWFRIEKHWDYAYVEASSDGGKTWTILEGAYTTSDNPTGNSFGAGLTGASDGWTMEKVDLSRYVGGEVLVRFEYITDAAVHLDGLLIDDIAVPEVGFFDGAEREHGWQAEGFERTDTILSQGFAVQVIEAGIDGTVSVRSMSLGEDLSGQIMIEGFGSRLEHAVLVVAPVTLGTHRPAHFTLVVEPVEGR